MEASIENGAFAKWLENGVPVDVSVQSAGCGGDVRFTSFCFRHPKAAPTWLTCGTWACLTPLTRSQPP